MNRQRKCQWCGEAHGALDCRVSDEMKSFLRRYANAGGRTWKSRLRADWQSGLESSISRRVRNIIGPNQLAKITQAVLDA